ncbi:hypothetical protein M885DRAFT_527538 [Pelagophyceae sp. CCMP2097]|nr:hypothetical protein M885DRAFT_527538 [Pelagophyceae sp. CCMP2097]
MVVQSPRFVVQCASREKAIRLQEAEVQFRRTEVFDARERQRTRRYAKKTTSRLGAWRGAFDIQKSPEAQLRPSDREFPARLYSKMDQDVWQMEELRLWFDKNAPAQTGKTGVFPQASPRGDPTQTGYLVKAFHQSAAPPRQQVAPHRPSPSPALPRLATPPNFMHFEDQLAVQQHNATLRLQQRNHFPTQGQNRQPGCSVPPWMDRPHG